MISVSMKRLLNILQYRHNTDLVSTAMAGHISENYTHLGFKASVFKNFLTQCSVTQYVTFGIDRKY